jgi:hypothetical protein
MSQVLSPVHSKNSARHDAGFHPDALLIVSAVGSVTNARRPSPGVSQRNAEPRAPRALSDTSKIENDLLGRP